METTIFDSTLNKWWIITDEIGNSNNESTSCIVAAYGSTIDEANIEIDNLLDRFNRNDIYDVVHMIREKDKINILIPRLTSYNSIVAMAINNIVNFVRTENMN